MKKILLPLLGSFALVAALSLARGESSVTSAGAPLDAEEQAFLGLINQYRQQNGLGPLTIDPNLQDAADWMSVDMGVQNYFSHTDHLGRDPFQRMAAFGYNYNTWLGENIAAGAADAQTVFNLWKGSPGHNVNMLTPEFKAIGIGRAFTSGSGYGWYWTNDFGGYAVPATPTPSAAPSSDIDGDGFSAALELHVGTNPSDRCSWPVDINGNQFADISDISALTRAFDQQSPPAPLRIDLAPDPGFDNRVDIKDIAKITTVFGQRCDAQTTYRHASHTDASEPTVVGIGPSPRAPH